MSMTRRQLLVRCGRRGRLGSAPAALIAADRLGAFDGPPPFDRVGVSRAGARRPSRCSARRATTATSRACCSTALRLVRAGRPRPLGAPQAEPRRVRPPARRSTPTRASSSRPRTRFAASGASSVVVAEGPGHRRDTEAVAARVGAARGARRRAAPVRRPQRRPARPDAAPHPLHGAARALGPARPPRDGGRRLDAEAQDAPLGRRHAVAEELLRLHAGSRLRLAEGRLPRARDPGVDPRHRRRGAPVARDRRRHRRHGGRRPDHGRPGRRPASSSSRATSSPPTSPGRASWGWIPRRCRT